MDEYTPFASEDNEDFMRGAPPAKSAGSWWLWVLLPVMFLGGLGVGYLLWGQQAQQLTAMMLAQTEERTAQATAQAANRQEIDVPAEVTRYPIPVDGFPSIGPDDAPITLVEFSDYECPYCKQWHSEVFNQIRAQYPDQVRMVYRNFPLTQIHPNAAPAAEAALCAQEQDRFWEFHEQIFTAAKLSPELYEQIAKSLRLDMKAFQTCVSERRYQQTVEEDQAWAAEFGVSSTPTFFLNGIPLVGAQPYDIFSQVIDKELAGEIPK
jgi:protein-disulfide isomerase